MGVSSFKVFNDRCQHHQSDAAVDYVAEDGFSGIADLSLEPDPTYSAAS